MSNKVEVVQIGTLWYVMRNVNGFNEVYSACTGTYQGSDVTMGASQIVACGTEIKRNADNTARKLNTILDNKEAIEQWLESSK